MYKSSNCVIISTKAINNNELVKIQSYFYVCAVFANEIEIEKKYIKDNDITFIIIYNYNMPLEFCIKTANNFKNNHKIHSIIVNKTNKEENYLEYLNLSHILIIKDVNELNEKYDLVYQKKLLYDKQDLHFNFFLNLAELIDEIVIISNIYDDIIYINNKGINELGIYTAGQENLLKISNILNITTEDTNEKITFNYNIKNNPEFENVTINDCLLNLNNNKKTNIVLHINTIDKDIIGKLIVIKDVTYLKKIKKEQEKLLYIDAQTGLKNIYALFHYLNNEIVYENKKQCYLININLNINREYQNKKILNNDLFQELLTITLSYISDHIFIINYHDLVIVIKNTNESKSLAIANKIKIIFLKRITKKIFMLLSLSMGIIKLNPNEDTEKQINKLKIATKISYDFKNSEPIIYKEDLYELQLIKNQNKILQYALKAIENDLFTLYYQKIMPLKKELTPKIEILARLFDYEGKIIPNDKIFALIDKYNLTEEVDKLIMQKALKEYKKFVEKHGTHIFSINISPYSLKSENFKNFLKNTLLQSNVPLKNICLELTETGILKNFEIINEYFTELRNLGIKIALDDFGSGYTSISYIKTLPIDILKIDGSFIKLITSSHTDYIIIKAIKDIADTQNIEIIAEFVANEAILAKIEELNLDYGQGFLWHKPEPF